MPTLEERVGHLEQEVAELQGQLRSDLKHIDRRFDDLDKDISKLYDLIGEVNKSLAGLGAGNAVVNQKSTTNEKIIFAVVGTLISALTFVVGKIT